MMNTDQTPQLDHQRIIGFKIWYSDSTFNSKQGSWADAPDDDVQVVMIYFAAVDGLGRHTRLYSSGCDVYALDEANGRFTSAFEDRDDIAGIKKHGKYTNFEKLRLIEEMAFQDFGEGWLVPEKEKVGSNISTSEKMEL